MSQKKAKRLAVLASGGPAPGINSVINAATIEAINLGWEVLGVRDGFAGLRDDRLKPLSLEDVAFIHYEGGCVLGMARVNPRGDTDTMRRIVATLKRHEVDMLMTIGGDGTAFGCREIAAEFGPSLRTVHVPKTIDNDLPLPQGVPTFGFTTARQVGVQLVQNLIRDARTCSRWYVVVSMGRQAGHLALGIGKAAGASLTLIPEEFPEDRFITLAELADILEGAVIKGRSRQRAWGVAVIAEGVIEKLAPQEIEQSLPGIQRDAFGQIRLADVQLGDWLCGALTERMKRRGVSTRFNDVKLGYELRCAAPVPFDIEYTRDLGFAAVRFLAEGGSGAMVMIVDGRRRMADFGSLRDPRTGLTRVRGVNIEAESYMVARRYMQRLTRQDFERDQDLERLASAAECSVVEFRDRFEYLVQEEPRHYGWGDGVRDRLDF